jgi:hypothetical protein
MSHCFMTNNRISRSLSQVLLSQKVPRFSNCTYFTTLACINRLPFINCNLYGYNYKCFLSIFLTMHSSTCNSRLVLDTEFLGHQTELPHTLLTVSSVMLGLPVRPFPWWQMQRLSQHCSNHLQTDDAGWPQCPNRHWYTHWTATMLSSFANSRTHELCCWNAAILPYNDIYCHIYRVCVCGSVINNNTWVRIGYRIYSLWRFQLQQITIIINT